MSLRILEEDSDSSMQQSIASLPSQSTASERPGSRPGSMRAMLLVKACGRSVVVPEGNGVTLMLLHVQKALQKELEAEDQVFKIQDSAGGRIRTDQELREAVLNGRTPLKAKPATAPDTMIKREELAQIICQVVQEQLQMQVASKIGALTQQVGFLTEELESFKKEWANLKEREELAQIETKREELAQIICQVVQEQQAEVFSELGRLASDNERLNKELENVTTSVDLISRETSAVQRVQKLHKDLVSQMDVTSAYGLYSDINDKASPLEAPMPCNEAPAPVLAPRLPLAEMLLAPSPSPEEVSERLIQGTPNQQSRVTAPGLALPGDQSVLQPMRSTVTFADSSFKKQGAECSKSASPAQDWRRPRTTQSLPSSEEVRRRPLSSDGIRSDELAQMPNSGASDATAWRRSLPSGSVLQNASHPFDTSRWGQGVPLQPGLIAPMQPGPLQPVQLGAQSTTAATLQPGPPPGLTGLQQGKVVFHS